MRKVSENPLAGTQVWHEFDESEQVHKFVTHYDKDLTQAVLDRNKQLEGHGMNKEWRLAGSIPPLVLADWIAQGANPLSADPEQQRKARALYNSSEFHKVRINDFKI